MFNSVGKAALFKGLSFYGKQDKYNRMISAMYENKTAAVKVRNEDSSWFCIKSGIKQGCVLSPFI